MDWKLELVVSDIDAARTQLLDGNRWAVQQIVRPG
jgi:hypothetical protein